MKNGVFLLSSRTITSFRVRTFCGPQSIFDPVGMLSASNAEDSDSFSGRVYLLDCGLVTCVLPHA